VVFGVTAMYVAAGRVSVVTMAKVRFVSSVLSVFTVEAGT
jgi:hypothetical protein